MTGDDGRPVRDDLPVVELMLSEVFILFVSAVDREDWGTVERWASLILQQNDRGTGERPPDAR